MLTTYNGKVYFQATDGQHGIELWVSDGTQAGSSMVADIWPGAGSSGPYYLTTGAGKLFFTAIDSLHGTELWVSDGTSAGTMMVSDINPGPGSSVNLPCITELNGKVYFAADDGVHGTELWVSDGTSAGTAMVKDIYPGLTSSSPFGFSAAIGEWVRQFTVFNNKLYFRAYDPVNGIELWCTDGTTGGTTMVADIWPGPNSSVPFAMTELNGKLIFTAGDSLHGSELWVTDGTSAGTSLLKDMRPGIASSDPADFSAYTLYHNKLYFNARTDNEGMELWSTDGTSAGTAMVKDIWPGAGDSYAGMEGFLVYNDKLFFNANDSVNGKQLWVSDGTTAGTTLFKILSSYTPCNSYPTGFVNYNNRMIFVASTDSVNGVQLWTSDGTPAGTHVIAPAIAPNANPLSYATGFYRMAIANGSLFMNANFNSIGDELWIYSTPTGITEASGEHAISAYPNPFSTVVSLSGLVSGEQYDVQVLDMTGREFYRTAISADQSSVSMPELSTGVYLMTVSGQSHSQTFKLVKN
jgi:ELWxxDGT repeat protein